LKWRQFPGHAPKGAIFLRTLSRSRRGRSTKV